MLSSSPPNFGSPFAPCEAIHPSIDSCAVVPIDRFLAVFKWMIPIYGALHFIPPLLFKRKLFMQNPMKMLLRSGFGTLRSSAFFGMVVVIFQSMSLPPLRKQKKVNASLNSVFLHEE